MNYFTRQFFYKKLIFTYFIELIDHIKGPKYNADCYEYRKI